MAGDGKNGGDPLERLKDGSSASRLEFLEDHLLAVAYKDGNGHVLVTSAIGVDTTALDVVGAIATLENEPVSGMDHDVRIARSRQAVAKLCEDYSVSSAVH